MIDKSVTYKSYFVGLGISIALTLASYFSVTLQLFEHIGLYALIMMLAVVQVLIQVVYFLHIGHENKPRWNLISLIFSVIIVFIIIAGSMWVMYNLNTNMMH